MFPKWLTRISKSARAFVVDSFERIQDVSPSRLSLFLFIIVPVVAGGLLKMCESQRMVTGHLPIEGEVTFTHSDGSSKTIFYTDLERISYKGERLIDCVFTAVSAVCVTGLTSTDFSKFSLMGKVITLFLIQIGGLGIMTFTSFLALMIERELSRRMGFRAIMSAILDTNSTDDDATHEWAIKQMLFRIIKYTFIIEGVGILLLASSNPDLMDGVSPVWFGIFHSISAFNNAGFSLIQTNLANFATDPLVSLTIASLIILGGLGYPLLIVFSLGFQMAFHFAFDKPADAENEKRSNRLVQEKKVLGCSHVQTITLLAITGILLVGGTLLALIVEWRNPIFVGFSFGERLLACFFQSVTCRTAGFNTVDIGRLSHFVLQSYICLMFIGANPAGTAGGVKTSTVAVIYGYLKDFYRPSGEPVKFFEEPIDRKAVSSAIRLAGISVIFVTCMMSLIMLFERKWLNAPDTTFHALKIVFEVVSAFGTVGLSMGFSGGVANFSGILSSWSKICLIITMIVGRVGPLTVMAAFHRPSTSTQERDLNTKFQIG